MILAIVKFILPAVVVTDLLSEFFGSALILNLSRIMRILLLIIFIFENVRLINTIKNFRYFYYFLFFSLILFLYLILSDPFIGNGIFHPLKNIIVLFLKNNLLKIIKIPSLKSGKGMSEGLN